jgi:atypical dual specificity phosphatase
VFQIEEVRQAGGRTLVHCTAGVSRSASLCLAYLMKYEHMALRKAFSHLRSVRPAVRPNSGFFRQLIDLERRLLGHESVAMVHNAAAGMQIPDVYEIDYQKMLWFQQNYRTSLGRH